jgi:DNA mismatch repair protein MutS
MFQSTEPLGRELAKESKKLRQRMGARHLRNGRDALLAEQNAFAKPALQPETDQVAGRDAVRAPDTSLVWPSGRDDRGIPLYEDSIRDLDLPNIAMAIAAGSGKEQRDYVMGILCQLCDDPEVIEYRQDVIADLLRFPRLAAGLEELLPLLDDLALESIPSRQTTELFQITWWLGALETYVECIRRAAESFRQVDGELGSEGLSRFRDQIVAVEQDGAFQSLVEELPALLSRVRGVVSITVGINLDPDLHPEAATLLSVNDQKFAEAPLLRMLLGHNGEYEAVMPLHSVPTIPARRDGGTPNRMLIPLFRDLSTVMEEVTKPIGKALRQYMHLEHGFLLSLQRELAFYVGAASLIRRLGAAGLTMCRPELAPREERMCEVQDSYNLNLALHLLEVEGDTGLKDILVQNDVTFNSEGRIIVLTGPNQGGKTTYVQGIGLLQALAQVGLYVPGTSARLSPADNVYTHFPVEEELSEGTGRFGDEARRLDKIFQGASRHSLVLLNESLSGTHAGESFYLARDVLRIWRLLGTRVVYATHMHELAAQVEQLNAQSPGDSPIISMVSSWIDKGVAANDPSQAAVERSYRVIKSPPMGRSYARELATLYGISFEQLIGLLRKRGVLDHDGIDYQGKDD